MFLLLTVEHVITSSDEAKELLFQHVCTISVSVQPSLLWMSARLFFPWFRR